MQERKTVIVTGASSGIGREAALQFADEGYYVVLVARREEELNDVARLCEEAGVETLVGALDMSDEKAVKRLALEAAERFGGFDVWVNAAGTYAAGNADEVPLKDMRRVMDVNFFGYLIGSRAALARFKEQGFGTLVNVASVNAGAPQPFGSIYAASKAAQRSLDESLRMEIDLDGWARTINVCTVLPAGVDTNIYRNSANYTGNELLAIEPVYSPTTVGRKIVALARRPKRETFIGIPGRFFILQHRLFPRSYDVTTPLYTKADVLGDGPAADTPGNLYEPIRKYRGSTGGWQRRRVNGETVDRIIVGGLMAGAIASAIGVLAVSGTKFRNRHK